MIAALSLATALSQPRDVVVQLYREYAWEAMLQEPAGRNGLLAQPPAELRRFFDDRLVSLILKDRECEKTTQGVCNLDFDPIWDSQDPAAYDMRIKPATESGIVRVEFLLPGCEKLPNPGARKKATIDYQVVKTPNGWRIADIRGLAGSLVDILSGNVR